MNKQLSLSMFSKESLSSIKLPKGITFRQVALMVVGLILLGLAIYFAISYFGAASKRTDLNRDVELKHQQINAIGGPQSISALQSQLEQAQQDLIDDNPFPPDIDKLEVTRLILEAAADANVVCFQYTPSDESTSTINGHTYAENTFGIGSSGEGSTGEKINRIIKFLKNIEELPYNAVSIEGLALSSVSEEGTWGVSFMLSILSQP